ncbi:TPA: hypothetical protein EYP44_01650 [Candidatus Bathyarchaeota archaeon]|nr:hypothetical protein [Candidatus Bathyarchaeota archaeon]
MLVSDVFVFGLVKSRVMAKGFESRRPSRRPFFHPVALHPKLARCMVNLSRPRRGDVLLDPFCGTGGLLIEGELIGCKTIGSDVDPEMVRGCRRNMAFYGLPTGRLLIADARRAPFSRVDAISTDSPFGKSTKTFGATAIGIITDFLSNVDRMLPKGKFVCLSAPMEMGLGEIGEGLGLYLVETYTMTVHRALTREICVFKR